MELAELKALFTYGRPLLLILMLANFGSAMAAENGILRFVSPDKQYEVRFRPKPGEEEFTSVVQLIKVSTGAEVTSETFIPYYDGSESRAEWNTSSTVAMIVVKDMKWGESFWPFNIAGEDGWIKNAQEPEPTQENGEPKFEYSHKSSGYFVRWLSASDYMQSFKAIKRRLPDGEWQEERGFTVIRVVQTPGPRFRSYELAKGPEPKERYEAADYELNQYYADYMAHHGVSKEFKSLVKQAQRKWIEYRDAEAACDLDTETRYETLTGLTRDRIKDFKTKLQALSEF